MVLIPPANMMQRALPSGEGSKISMVRATADQLNLSLSMTVSSLAKSLQKSQESKATACGSLQAGGAFDTHTHT